LAEVQVPPPDPLSPSKELLQEEVEISSPKLSIAPIQEEEL